MNTKYGFSFILIIVNMLCFVAKATDCQSGFQGCSSATKNGVCKWAVIGGYYGCTNGSVIWKSGQCTNNVTGPDYKCTSPSVNKTNSSTSYTHVVDANGNCTCSMANQNTVEVGIICPTDGACPQNNNNES